MKVYCISLTSTYIKAPESRLSSQQARHLTKNWKKNLNDNFSLTKLFPLIKASDSADDRTISLYLESPPDMLKTRIKF